MEELEGAGRFGVMALAVLAVVLLLPPLVAPWLVSSHYAGFPELQPLHQWALLVPGLLVLASAIGLLLVVRRHTRVFRPRILLVALLVAVSMGYAAVANQRMDLHHSALLVVQRDFYAQLSALHALGLADFRYTPAEHCAAGIRATEAHPVRLPEEAAWKSGLELRLLTAGCTAPEDYPQRLAALREAADARAAESLSWLPDSGVLAHVHTQLDPSQPRHQQAMQFSREAREGGKFSPPQPEAVETLRGL